MSDETKPSALERASLADMKSKRPYQAPEICEIVLVAEEAILGACKNVAVAGPSSSDCTVTSCSSAGS